MPNIQIEVISVGAIQKVPTAKGFYETVEVAYRKDGKVEGKKIMSFANPAIFKAVQKLAQGETVDVTTEKNEAGFWQWTGLNSGAAVTQPTPSQTSSAASTGTVAAKPVSNYETKEETSDDRTAVLSKQCCFNFECRGKTPHTK
jgi:activator of HSP90 ATPase